MPAIETSLNNIIISLPSVSSFSSSHYTFSLTCFSSAVLLLRPSPFSFHFYPCPFFPSPTSSSHFSLFPSLLSRASLLIVSPHLIPHVLPFLLPPYISISLLLLSSFFLFLHFVLLTGLCFSPSLFVLLILLN